MSDDTEGKPRSLHFGSLYYVEEGALCDYPGDDLDDPAVETRMAYMSKDLYWAMHMAVTLAEANDTVPFLVALLETYGNPEVTRIEIKVDLKPATMSERRK